MSGHGVHKNIPVSHNKLTLGLPVGYTSSNSTAHKLFPVHPRVITGPPKMSPPLHLRWWADRSSCGQRTPVLYIKPGLILVVHTDDLVWWIMPTSMDRCPFKTTADCQQTKCYARADAVFQLTWCFRKTFILRQSLKKDAQTTSAYTTAINVIKLSKIRSSRSGLW